MCVCNCVFEYAILLRLRIFHSWRVWLICDGWWYRARCTDFNFIVDIKPETQSQVLPPFGLSHCIWINLHRPRCGILNSKCLQHFPFARREFRLLTFVLFSAFLIPSAVNNLFSDKLFSVFFSLSTETNFFVPVCLQCTLSVLPASRIRI